MTYDQYGVEKDNTVFVYSNGKLIAEYSTETPPQNPTTRFTITDQLDSPRVIIDSAGDVISRRDFLPFGEEIDPDGTYRTTALKYGQDDNVRQNFTGYQHDAETGLDFAEARMYENRHGRFTAVDPLLASGKSADPQTFNRYVYVMNNPLVLTDPTGLQAGSPTYLEPCNTGPNCGDFTQSEAQRRKNTVTATGSVVVDVAINLVESYIGSATDLFRMSAERFDAYLKGGGPRESPRIIGNIGPAQDPLMDGVMESYATAAKIGLAGISIQSLFVGGFVANGTTMASDSGLSAGLANVPRGFLVAGQPNAGGFIRSFLTSSDQTFFRVSSAAQHETGGFLTATAPRSSAFARESLALPTMNDASLIQEVSVPAGTLLQRSRTISNFGRRGGGEQFQLFNPLPAENFGPRQQFETFVRTTRIFQ